MRVLFAKSPIRKGEPEWMLEFRLKALAHFNLRANANLGSRLIRFEHG